jgi:Na+-translocating ferredoxin:NAD+ oxidoreductase RnfG subunit
MNKKMLKPIIVLSVICLSVAIILGGVNMITEKKIAETKAEIIAESLESVMPGINPVELARDEYPAQAPKSVTTVYRDNASGGYVVLLEKQGYASVIGMTVGIDAEGKITKAVVTSEAETHGKGGFDEYVAAFSGTDASSSQSITHVSGATKTSNYIKSAVYDAFVVLGYAAPKTEETPEPIPATPTLDRTGVIAIANEILEGEYTPYELDDASATTVRVLKRSEGGYAIHIATRTEWRPLETEGVVVVNRYGTIVGVKMVYWEAGWDGESMPKPPLSTDEFAAHEEAQLYIDSFIGKNAYTLTRVDLITHVTNSSNNFENALTSTLLLLYPAKNYTAATVSVLVTAALIALGYVIYKRRKTR